MEDIGDVDGRGEDGNAGGANFLNFAGNQAEEDVDVVNHEVEDDIDIQAAWAEDAQAVDFEKQRLARDFFQRHDGGVETL